jgi:hypothetical protein
MKTYIDHGGNISHEPHSTFHRFLGVLFEFFIMWDLSFGSELLTGQVSLCYFEGELVGDLHFFFPAPPGFNVIRLSDSKGSTSVDESPVCISMSGSYDPLFVSTQTIGFMRRRRGGHTIPCASLEQRLR